MATLVNKHNREVKIIIPNLREFRTFYSDNKGVIGMFFKRDWVEVNEAPSWKPSEEQMNELRKIVSEAEVIHNGSVGGYSRYTILKSLYEQLKKL